MSGTPYGTDRAEKALRLAEAAINRGHKVGLFLSADGTYAALSGQGGSGLPQIGEILTGLIAKSVKVELCGGCLRFRGLSADKLVAGTKPSTLRGLGRMVCQSDVVVNL